MQVLSRQFSVLSGWVLKSDREPDEGVPRVPEQRIPGGTSESASPVAFCQANAAHFESTSSAIATGRGQSALVS